jgi:hypothetical protein
LPLAGALTWRIGRGRDLIKAASSVIVVSLVLAAPYIIAGTFGELMSLPGRMMEIGGETSANATNLWWLIIRGSVSDELPWLGDMSYATWGYFFAAVLGVFAIIFILRTYADNAPEAFALMAFGFAMLATKAHENHTFQALGLLASAGVFSSYRFAVYCAISATLLINMTLFTPDIFAWLARYLNQSAIAALTFFSAVINIEILVFWLVVLARKLKMNFGVEVSHAAQIVRER